MSDRQAMEAVVAKLYDDRNGDNIEGIFTALHPECEFRIAGTDRLGQFTRAADTPEAIRGTVQALKKDWDLSGMSMISLHIDGNTALAHRAGTIRHIPTGESFDTEFLDKISFKDGKVVKFIEFIDTYQIAGAAGLI